MTYNKEKNDFIYEITDRIRQKIEVLDAREDVVVEIRPGKPLRNSNPAVIVAFTSPQILAEVGFWSSKTFELGAYDNIANEVILGDAGYFTSLDDVDRYIDQILALYLASGSEGSTQ